MVKGKFESEPAYVILKSGQKIEGNHVSKKEGGLFTRGKVTVNGKDYKPKEVAMYSDGTSTFANIGKNMYAEKFYGDKIKVFRYTAEYTEVSKTSYGTKTSQKTRIRDYIQQGNTTSFKPLTYKTVKKLIPEGAAGYDYLVKYKKSRFIAKTLMAGGAVLFFTGAIMGFSAMDKDKSGTAGFAIMGIGGLAFLSSPFFNFGNRDRLYKAIEAYNQGGDKAMKKR